MHDGTNTADGADPSDADPPLDRDVVFELLADDRRRIVLSLLPERAGPIDLDALASDVAARETARDEAPADLIRRVRIALQHSHLPRLDDHGVVDYDAAERTVSYLGDAGIETCLRVAPDGDE